MRSFCRMARRLLQFGYALLVVLAPSSLHAADTLQWSGFADFRGASAPDGLPLRSDSVSAQAQLGIDWRPAPFFAAHVHLLARSDDDEAQRGHAGVVEAYLEQYLMNRLRLKERPLFLPTSPEDV